MKSINIQKAENGFVVYEQFDSDAKPSQPAAPKVWAFESANSVSIFVKEWGNEMIDSNDAGERT